MKHSVLFFIVLLSCLALFAQTQQDTIITKFTQTPVVIDGSDADECWNHAEWYAIDQVWMPYNATMASGDFEGRFKASWDANYLYILVEVRDDILSDDHPNPLQNWWDDDCLELFIDEDRSKGNHERNNNAFAYHVSLSYDAIDLNSSGAGINYKNNLSVVMDTIGENLYLWELALKMYNKNFNPANPEASRVKLSPNKLMGFTIAYCDNDATSSRENFIGSMYMTSDHRDDNYKTADYFGSMLLTDTENKWVSAGELSTKSGLFSFYPNPVDDYIYVETTGNSVEGTFIEIHSVEGKTIRKIPVTRQKQAIDVSTLKEGLYLVYMSASTSSQSEIFLKK